MTENSAQHVAVVVSPHEGATNVQISMSPICLAWFTIINMIIVGILVAFSGIGGLVMVILGGICLDRETSRQPTYCADLDRSGQIILVAIGCILVCCCGFRVKYRRQGS